MPSSAAATRVIARTWDQEIRPAEKAVSTSGSSRSRPPTRTRSRAAVSPRPVRHDGQCAHDSNPGPLQASRRSNSPISASRWASPAAIRPDQVVISSAGYS
jgi:hypothetical protein